MSNPTSKINLGGPRIILPPAILAQAQQLEKEHTPTNQQCDDVARCIDR